MLARVPARQLSLDPLMAEAKRRARQRRLLIAVIGVLIAPLLFLLIFGILAFARARDYRNQLAQLASQGARAAAVNRNPDGTRLSSTDQYSIQQQLATTYAKQRALQKGIVVCIESPVPANPGDPVTVKASYRFNLVPLIGAAAGALHVSVAKTERSEFRHVGTNGSATYVAGNQKGNDTGC